MIQPLIREVIIAGGGKVEGGDPAGEAGVVLQAAVRRPETNKSHEACPRLRESRAGFQREDSRNLEIRQNVSPSVTYAAWFPHSTCVTLISHCLPVVVSVLRKLKLIVAESDAVAPRST